MKFLHDLVIKLNDDHPKGDQKTAVNIRAKSCRSILPASFLSATITMIHIFYCNQSYGVTFHFL